MNKLSRCSGHHGKWACEDEYPDHMVPVENFGSNKSSKDGTDNRCRKCLSIRNAYQFTNQRPRHPETGEAKMDWKRRMAMSLGGKRGKPEWQDYLDKTEIQWSMEIENNLLDIADKVTPSISPEREFGPYLPMTSYKSTERIGMEVEDGDVYVVQNPLTPDIQKVGKTFPNGIAAILAAARRFGPAILIYEQWFPLAFEAEQAVHKILEPYNLRKLRGPNPETGLYDCGIELFECSVETVLKAIEEVSIDTKKK